MSQAQRPAHDLRANPELARELGRKGRKGLDAARAARLALEIDQANRTAATLSIEDAILPGILANEVAFRSAILERLRRLETRLLEEIDQGLYSSEKVSLPQMVKAWKDLAELSLRIVTESKAMPGANDRTAQVAGLLQREALLRKELQARGVLDEHGNIRDARMLAEEKAEEEATPTAEPAPRGEGGVS